MQVEDASLQEIVPGVFAWMQPEGGWWVNNAGFVTDEDAREAMVIDTCVSSERTRRFLDEAHRATGGARVRMALNTHQHGDHTYGNHLLPESTVILSQERARDGILADTIFTEPPRIWEPMPDWSDAVLRAPEVTFGDRAVVHLGGRRVELHHPGETAHTPGDAVAWLPEERVLFAGDLVFNQGAPLIFMGDLAGSRRSLEWLAEFGAEHLVPGHGALLSGADEIRACLDDLDGYFALVEKVDAHSRAHGLSPLEAARTCDLGRYADRPDAERIVLNLHRVRADREGVPMDMADAFADTLAHAGGPLHCEA